MKNYFEDLSTLGKIELKNLLEDRTFCLAVEEENWAQVFYKVVHTDNIDNILKPLVLTERSVMAGIKEVPDSCFELDKSLKTFIIPEGVRTISEKAFRGCTNLESIYIPDSVTTIGYGAFQDCKNLKHIDLPKNLRLVGGMAFAGSGLESVYFPESLNNVGDWIFLHCENLKKVSLSRGWQTSDFIETITEGWDSDGKIEIRDILPF